MAINKAQAFWIGNVIGISVLVAVIAVTSHQRQAASLEQQKAQDAQDANAMATVVVAQRDIAAGHQIVAADLGVSKVKFGKMAFGTITLMKDTTGLHALVKIKKGTVITSALLSD